MNDPEFIMLRNRFLIGILVALIFIMPLFFFFKNKIISNEDIIREIRNKEKIIILVVENNCIECKNYQQKLNNNDVDYMKVNKIKDKDYELILNELNISSDDITTPAIIYVKNKKVANTKFKSALRKATGGKSITKVRWHANTSENRNVFLK